MTDLIASYEEQLAAIIQRIRTLHMQRRSCAGNLTYGQLTRRIEVLEEEQEELECLIGEIKKHQ